MKKLWFVNVGTLVIATAAIVILLGAIGRSASAIADPDMVARLAASAPAVTNVDPASAPNDIDTSIVITGTDFTAVPTITVGSATLADVGWVSSTTLTATVPWGLDAGVYTVTVTNPDGTSGSLSRAFTVTQGIGVWTSNGPYGGAVTTLLVNPVTTTALYAAVQAPTSASGIGLFRSFDGGLSWAMIFADIGNQFHAADLSTPAPTVIYADKWGQGLYRSDDGGDNWAALPMPAGIGGDINPYAYPTDPQVVYATANCASSCGGVYRSDDRGSHWITLTVGLTDTRVTALAFDPANPQSMYAGTSNGNMFGSGDGGHSWSFIGQPDQFISNLAVNPFGSHEVWAAGADSNGHWGYLWKYAAGSWTQVLPGTGQENNATSIAFNQTISGTMWIGALEGSMKSTDGGGTWASFGASTQSVNSLAADPGNSGTFYLGYNGAGIYKMANDGVSWTESNDGLAGIYPTGLAINPADTAVVYATASGLGAFKTNNGGGSWLKIPSNNQWPWSPVVDPFNPKQIYVGTTNGVDITDNDGQTWNWVVLNPPPQFLTCCSNNVAMLSLLPTGQPGHLVMGVDFNISNASSYASAGGGIYTSTDYGVTWGYVDIGQVISAVTVLASNPDNPATIYAGTGNCCANMGTGVWKSADSGTTWSPSGLSGKQITGLAVDPFNPQLVYAASHEQFYVSSNGGVTWTLRSTQDYGMDSLLVEPTTPPTLYQYGWRGVVRSVDGGLHWGRAVGSLGYAKIGVMATAIAQGRVVLYVGTGGGTLTGTAQREQGFAASDGNLVNGGVYRNTVLLLLRHVFLPLIQR